MGKVKEGSAIFWRMSRFKMTASKDVLLRDVREGDGPGGGLGDESVRGHRDQNRDQQTTGRPRTKIPGCCNCVLPA